jgi:MYXO-CTERM domain-containing protein
LFLLLALSAHATTVTGDRLSLSWNTGGTLNDTSVGTGLVALHGETWVEWTYAGLAWQGWAVAYTVDGEDRNVHANSALGTTAFIYDGETLSADGRVGMRWAYATPELTVTKTETFASRGSALRVTFQVENHGSRPVDLLRVLYALDPDPEVAASGSYNTRMDVRDRDGDGVDDYTDAVGPSLDYTMGFGGCDPEVLTFGAWNDWTAYADADAPLSDFDGTEADAAIGVLWWPEGSLLPGRATAFTFVVVLGDSPDSAERAMDGELTDACCDQDLDGAIAVACGGDDCDDRDPSVAPGLPDPPYDGVDADCGGGDDADVDGDGEVGVEGGGLDCDDTDPAVRTGTAEVWYDGVDQNCDGNDDDQDYDGFPLAFDCDDTDPTVHEDCPEPDAGDDGAVDAGTCGCGPGGPMAPASALLVGLGVLVAGRRRR